MIEYSMIFAKLGIGLLVIIFQINIMLWIKFKTMFSAVL